MKISSDQKKELRQIMSEYQSTDKRIEELKQEIIKLRDEYNNLSNKIKDLEAKETTILQSLADTNPDYSFNELIKLLLDEEGN